MKIVSFNVNGLRSALKKNLAESLHQINADVVCLQEIKADQSQLRGPVLDGYTEHWNSSAKKKGYSGTLLLTKEPFHQLSNDIGDESLDGEGRLITAEFSEFFLLNVYTPNSQSGLKRIEFRQRWDAAMLDYMQQLEQSKPVILCGDLNVAHHEIDLASPSRHRGKHVKPLPTNA